MVIPKGYKQTEVGVIPEDWEVKIIGKFTDVITGGTPNTSISEFWNGDIPWMSSGELNCKRVYEVKGRITELGLKHSSTHMIPKNCVLIGLAGQGKTRGTVAVNFINLCTNQSIAAIIPNKSFCYEYLYQNLENRYNELRDISSGDGGRGGLNKKIIKNLKCPMPSISEQKNISTVLFNVDKLISSLEKLIIKKKAIKQGVMQDLLTGKRRLPGFTGERISKTIGEVGEFYSGLIGKNKKDFCHGESNYITFLNVLLNPVIDISKLEKVDVKKGENQNEVQNGDLFFNTSSETPDQVGMCSALLTEVNNTYLNSFCFGYRLIDDSCNPLYLSFLFNSNVGRKIMSTLAQGATRYNLSKSYFSDTVILVPTKAEQDAIVSILSDMDSEIHALEQNLEKYQQIKQGMMEQLLTGKIRLIESEKVQTEEKIKEKSQILKHNHQFDDAVTIAAIVNSFYSGTFPLGRKKVQKLLYLLRRKQESAVTEFQKKAAGPYADEIRYKGGEPIAKKKKYISVTTSKKGSIFAKGENIYEAIDYIDKWNLNDDINWLVSNFRRTKTDTLELLATIDMAICDLKNEGAEISLENIKKLIQSSKEWKAKLNKPFFKDSNITWAIAKCEKLFK